MTSRPIGCFASIIVPVYNAAPWLRACLHSILSQTCGDFELLLINDGSADESAAICNEYAQTDRRIRVLHKPHSGVSAARNAGLRLAAGEWVLFADADDVIHPQLVKILKEMDELHHAECYVWRYTAFAEEIHFPEIQTMETECLSHKALLAMALDSGSAVRGYVWNKAFRRSTLAAFSFHTDLCFQEDLLFVCEYLSSPDRHGSCCLLKAPLYGYRQRSSSACYQSFSAGHLTILLARDRIIQRLRQTSALPENEIAQLSNELALSACVMNKKLLFHKSGQRKQGFALVDRIWTKYASFARPAAWSAKEQLYCCAQRLCCRLRSIRNTRRSAH